MTAFGYTLILGAVALERFAEVVLSNRHAAWSLASGGVEHGRGHYPAMVVLHTGFLLGCLAEVWLLDRVFIPALGLPMLALAIACQALRWWCILTLGRRWNTRVIVIAGKAPIRSGPYRLFPHPNYVAVVLEGLALPLIHSAWITAAVFSILNAALLRTRIRCEDAALQGTSSLPAGGHA